MKKIENFLMYHTSSIVCFLFGFISAILAIIFFMNYNNYKDIYIKDLKDINYIEGLVTDVDFSKTNIEIHMLECDKKFFIRQKCINAELLEGDYVKIHYANNSFIRGEYYQIVNLNLNGDEVYALIQFKESINLNLYLGLFIGSLTVFVMLIIIGIILIKYNKPVYNIRKYIEDNKDKYKLTESDINLIVSQFEGYSKQELDKPKEEIYDLYKKSIYNKNNRTYISWLELTESKEYGDILFEVLADMVLENELKVFLMMEY